MPKLEPPYYISLPKTIIVLVMLFYRLAYKSTLRYGCIDIFNYKILSHQNRSPNILTPLSFPFFKKSLCTIV